jgi:hypothetical protein
MIRKTTNLPTLQRILKAFPGHSDQSIKEMLEYFCEKILIKHFSFSGGRERNYPKLDPKYAKRKLAKYGRQPILVASGVLRESATTMYKVYRKEGKYTIYFNIPEYGKYVIEKGRDWLTPSKKDDKDMGRYWKLNLAKRRKVFISNMAKK